MTPIELFWRTLLLETFSSGVLAALVHGISFTCSFFLTQEAHGCPRHKLVACDEANGHPLHESTVRGGTSGHSMNELVVKKGFEKIEKKEDFSTSERRPSSRSHENVQVHQYGKTPQFVYNVGKLVKINVVCFQRWLCFQSL